MSKVRITSKNRKELEKYIKSGQIDPNRVKIDLNKTKTASDNERKIVTLSEAMKMGYDFSFTYDIKPIESIKQENIVEQDLPELEVIGKKPKPSYNFTTLIEPYTTGRIKSVNKALDNPNFMKNWNLLQNIGDLINMASGGFINRISPSQNIRLLYDTLKGNDIFNNEGSWFGNSGIVSEQFAQEHPWLTMMINGATDYGLGIGIPKFTKSGLEYDIPVGKGAESTVYTRLFPTKVVRKVSSITPEEMLIRNKYNVPSKLKGQTADGFVYEQPVLEKANISLEDLVKLGRRYEMSPVFENGNWSMRSYDGKNWLEDLEGNIMFDPRRRRHVFSDVIPMDINEHAMLKKGGKLISKHNTGSTIIPRSANENIEFVPVFGREAQRPTNEDLIDANAVFEYIPSNVEVKRRFQKSSNQQLSDQIQIMSIQDGLKEIINNFNNFDVEVQNLNQIPQDNQYPPGNYQVGTTEVTGTDKDGDFYVNLPELLVLRNKEKDALDKILNTIGDFGNTLMLNEDNVRVKNMQKVDQEQFFNTNRKKVIGYMSAIGDAVMLFNPVLGICMKIPNYILDIYEMINDPSIANAVELGLDAFDGIAFAKGITKGDLLNLNGTFTIELDKLQKWLSKKGINVNLDDLIINYSQSALNEAKSFRSTFSTSNDLTQGITGNSMMEQIEDGVNNRK